MPRHPHLLKICADQLSPHVLGFAGDPHVRTPNLDRLAAAGTRFDNHYAACPICMPGRMSMITGRMPSRLNTPYFESVLDPNTPTYMRHFTDRGYQTTCVGKMHFHGQDQMYGWMFRPYGDLQMLNHGYSANYDMTKDVTGGHPHRPIQRGAAGGYNAWMLEHAGPGDTGNIRWDDSVTREAVENLTDYFTPSFIDEVYQGDRPLLFEVSFKTPHCPFVCPPDLFEYYMDILPGPTFPEPAVPPDQLPAFLRNKITNDVPPNITPEHIRRARAAYWGLVEWMDARVGDVLNGLDQLGVRDEFLVQFTADHGEMIGEHGMWQKHVFYEQSVRVPMLLAGPGVPADRIVTENTSHLDLYPTLCDLAELDVPTLGDEPWAGRSIRPLLEADGDGSRVALSEFRAPEGNDRAEGLPGGVWIVMAKRGDLKVIDYGNGDRQVFDLQTDPHERHTLPLGQIDTADLDQVIADYRVSVSP
ncbi:MAG: sulfatase-like hydrolase/transferase [Planctomycetota bacterium]